MDEGRGATLQASRVLFMDEEEKAEREKERQRKKDIFLIHFKGLLKKKDAKRKKKNWLRFSFTVFHLRAIFGSALLEIDKLRAIAIMKGMDYGGGGCPSLSLSLLWSILCVFLLNGQY